MPYPGVPNKYTKKIERCVDSVIADGKSKSSAIAICVNRIVPKKELEMSEKYREKRREREARQNKEASLLADNPLADSMFESMTLKDQTALPAQAVVDESQAEAIEVKEAPVVEKKGYAGTSYYKPYGGALSFDELDAYEKTLEEVEHMESVTYQFRAIIENVLSNDDIDHSEKAIMIQTASSVYAKRLQSYESEKGFLDKVKEFFGKKEKSLPDSAMGVIKTKDGYRWFGHYTNNYKDREGEILSAEAHKEFVSYLKQNPDKMPLFRQWHIKGTDRSKPADFIEYFDGFMIASGPLTEKEAEQLEKAIAYDDGKTGMSHGLYVLQRDPENPNVITRYRTFEISDLPLANAANGFTGINMKEVHMSDKKFKRLSAVIGEEAAKLVVDQIEDSKEILEELGVESKEDEVVADEEKEETEVAEEIEETTEDTEEEKETESDVKELAKAIIKELELDTVAEILHNQAERLGAVEDSLKSLQVEEDEKIAGLIEDKSLGALLWRPSEAEETELKEGEEETVEKNKPSWVSDVMS